MPSPSWALTSPPCAVQAYSPLSWTRSGEQPGEPDPLGTAHLLGLGVLTTYHPTDGAPSSCLGVRDFKRAFSPTLLSPRRNLEPSVYRSARPQGCSWPVGGPRHARIPCVGKGDGGGRRSRGGWLESPLTGCNAHSEVVFQGTFTVSQRAL